MEGFSIVKDGKHFKCLLAGSKSNEEERIEKKRRYCRSKLKKRYEKDVVF